MSERAMHIAAMLGLLLEEPAKGVLPGRSLISDPAAARAPIPPLELGTSAITLITGPSGSGKSTILRAIGRRAARRGRHVVICDPRTFASPSKRPAPRLVDLFQGTPLDSMRALARAGLGDAWCFFARPDELSTGQRDRLCLAIAMEKIVAEHKRARRSLLLIDEFASSLDRATAISLAALVRRFVSEHPIGRLGVFIATTRDEPQLIAALAPDRVFEMDLSHRLRPASPARRSCRGDRSIRITKGTWADYLRLAPLHYRSGPPATRVGILVARDHATPAPQFGPRPPIAVLVVSMPTLNGAWRRHAWPGVFDAPSKRDAARRLNHTAQGLRCISRVIVDPRYRSRGLAARIVRAYLSRPLTRYTEALAVMGRVSRFFDAAGMMRYETPPDARQARLLDLFEQFGLRPSSLADPRSAWILARRRIPPQLLRRELQRWGRSRRPSTQAPPPLRSIFFDACRSIISHPVAFAYTTRGRWKRSATVR